jgi:hypothetical protein
MKRWILPVGALMLALLIGIGALVAQAKEPKGIVAEGDAIGTLGSVDMEEIYNASGGPQDLDAAARQHEIEGEKRIQKLLSVPFLERAELEEFGTLIGKAQLTPDEEKKSLALKQESDKRGIELRALQVKPDDALKPEDKTRMNHLSELRQTLETQVKPGLIADFSRQQEGWVTDYRRRQLVLLRQDVAKVAKSKGIAHVFDAGTLVYSVNDLTPTVVQQVKKRAQGTK